jgi:RNA-directed DNA polymerase
MYINWDNFCSVENVYGAWCDFAVGKNNKQDVIKFKATLEDELLSIHEALVNRVYRHGSYTRFVVHDPKERVIHKATVHDRVVHRIVYNHLLPFFNLRWLDCSFSCRPGFGQHRAIARVQKALIQSTNNYTKNAVILKCDIKKFFDSIDQVILYRLITKRIRDERLVELINKIICSFGKSGRGLPIGNLTSQIFANIYMHELDWYIKHTLRQPFYFRYADDFLFVAKSKEEAYKILFNVINFLNKKLRLSLHPNKIIVRDARQGIDWLGKIILPGYMLLRPSTKMRMIKKVEDNVSSGCDPGKLVSQLGSYHGLLIGTARKELDDKLAHLVALVR